MKVKKKTGNEFPRGTAEKTRKKTPGKRSTSNGMKKILTGITILVGLVIVFVMVLDFYLGRVEHGKVKPGKEIPVAGELVPEKEVQVGRDVLPEPIETKDEIVEPGVVKKLDSLVPPGKHPVFEVFDDTGPVPVREPKEEVKDLLPRVAIIIDDIGFDRTISSAMAALDRNITLSILPGAPHAIAIAEELHLGGSEIMLHLPMEPMEYPRIDPGPGALLVSMTPDQLLHQLRRDLDSIPHVTGVNNHMGSRITSLSPQMKQIFTVLKQRDLFFIDSMTSKRSLCRPSARLLQISFAQRDVFLDNLQEGDYIKKQLEELVAVAKRHGTAIAIGHPYKVTYSTLKSEMKRLKSMVKIVPASNLVEISG